MGKWVYTFSKGISPKVKVIIRLEFKLTYNDIASQRVSHDVRATPPSLSILRIPKDALIYTVYCVHFFIW